MRDVTRWCLAVAWCQPLRGWRRRRDPSLCKQISDALIDRYRIYVQPINYPTVPRGAERLRITPTPHHSDADIEHLVQALAEIWAEVGLPRAA